MAKFNYKELNRSLASSAVGEKRVQTIAQSKFAAAHDILMEEFENHPVTKEIEGGIDSPNLSNTLPGIPDANLFSFIGFQDGTDPIDPIREILRDDIKMAKSGKQVNSTSIEYRFSLRIPRQALKQASLMEWDSGQSWIDGVENGISGFSYYIAKKLGNPPSRSLGGVQIKGHPIRSGTFKKTSYLSGLFANLKRNFLA